MDNLAVSTMVASKVTNSRPTMQTNLISLGIPINTMERLNMVVNLSINSTPINPRANSTVFNQVLLFLQMHLLGEQPPLLMDKCIITIRSRRKHNGKGRVECHNLAWM